MSHKSNLLIFGATGSIGQYITDAIVSAQDSFGRISIFTSPNTLTNKPDEINALRHRGVDILVGDITNRDEVLKAYGGVDTIISALGRGAIAAQIPLIQLANETPHIKRFLPSEYGTDIEYSPASQHEKPHQQKLKVRAALKEVRSDLEYAYVVTGPYADFPFYLGRSNFAKGGTFDAVAKKAVLLGDGQGRISLTACADVGKFVVHALTHWDAARNRALKVNSFTTTPAEILTLFENQTASDWTVEYTSLDELRAFEKEAWDKGAPEATLYTLRRIWTEGGTLYERRDNEDIGVTETTTLSELVKDSVQKQVEAGAAKH
ncbi:NAD(P)-binding protein [Aspergillus sclerotioniger CBS 115572]|uniref:NAD(P)-binding protein n=1 Tax=Aspergillus sclerotioniger CBS 115572 TaxID=1450535 RepID=A0A317UYG9_9EURO|nr:NAD(P)-binding protein [Aspergillus sclerotioniger CBS 115572]PWY67104.1 NAD(P)-binding protein [Aspergillus sclerotioniger CBS 115572]